jgi:hypothetical protein
LKRHCDPGVMLMYCVCVCIYIYIYIYIYIRGEFCIILYVLRRTVREEEIFLIQNKWRSKASWRLGPATTLASRNKDYELLKKIDINFFNSVFFV